MRKATIVILFFLSLLCTACKVSQSTIQTEAQNKGPIEAKPEQNSLEPQTPPSAQAEKEKENNNSETDVENKQAQPVTEPYTWVSFRGKVNVNLDGKQYSGNYFYVNRIDSIIYINVNVFGIEVARLVATPQEVIFVNKISYEYYKGDFSIVEKYFKTKADFYTLQAVFNGWEDQLQKYSNIRFAYQRCTLQDVNRPFFTHFEVEMDEGRRNAKVDVTNVKFNVPGPTGIKIPESFTPIK